MARSFPGTSPNYLHVGTPAALDITGTRLTMSAWVRPTGTGNANQQIACKFGNGLVDLQYSLQVASTGLASFAIADGSGGADGPAGVTNLRVDRWAHITGVKDGTGANAARIYALGKLEGVATSNLTIATDPSAFRIGTRSHDGGLNQYTGHIAHLAIWADVLSDREILLLSRGISPLQIRPGTLRGYWPLNDYGVSGVARDFSRYNNSATMTGAVPLTIDPYLDTLQESYIPPTSFLTGYFDDATVYLNLSADGSDIYEPGCFIIGDGEAQLRWSAGDQYLRWLGYDANLRWDANVRIGTAHC